MPTSSAGRAGAWVICTVGESAAAPSSRPRSAEQQARGAPPAPAPARHDGVPGAAQDGRAQRQRRAGQVAAGGQRQRQPELGAGAGLAPDLQPAAVQPGVLEADRQAEPAAADGPHPRRVGPPEPVEDVLRLGRAAARRPRSRTVTAAAVRLAARVISTGRPAPCSMALPTRLRRIRSTRRASTSAMTSSSGRSTTSSHSCRSASDVHAGDHAGDQRAEVGRLGVEDGGPGVVPADLQQVGEQPLEAVQLGPQQLGRAGHVRREVAARLVQHVGGHLHGRQRRPQLVRDVGGEPLLQLGEPLELGDLPLEAVGHRVEAGRQAGEVVLAADGHPLLELPLGQPLGGAGRPADRVDHEPGDQHADADDEQGQRDPADDRPCCGSARGSPPPGRAGRRSRARSARCPPASLGTGAPISRVGCGSPLSSGTGAYLPRPGCPRRRRPAGPAGSASKTERRLVAVRSSSPVR